MIVAFSKITMDHRGHLAAMLHASYDALMKDESGCWSGIAKELDDFDDDTFNNLETIGKCVFFTKMESMIDRLALFDPRPYPNYGIIGQNCILPACRRQGLGRRQIGVILS